MRKEARQKNRKTCFFFLGVLGPTTTCSCQLQSYHPELGSVKHICLLKEPSLEENPPEENVDYVRVRNTTLEELTKLIGVEKDKFMSSFQVADNFVHGLVGNAAPPVPRRPCHHPMHSIYP